MERADGRVAREAPRPGSPRVPAGLDNGVGVQNVWKYLRSNPQVLVLLIICLVLGLGTFVAVMIGLLSAHSSTTTGEPSGLITLGSSLMPLLPG